MCAKLHDAFDRVRNFSLGNAQTPSKLFSSCLPKKDTHGIGELHARRGYVYGDKLTLAP